MKQPDPGGLTADGVSPVAASGTMGYHGGASREGKGNKMLRIFRRRDDGKRGQGLVEFALTLPLALVVMIGIIDMGWYFFQYVTLANIARKAARKGAVGYSVRQINDLIMSQSTIKPNSITVTVADKEGKSVGSEEREENMVVTVTLTKHDPTILVPIGPIFQAVQGGGGKEGVDVRSDLVISYSCMVE